MSIKVWKVDKKSYKRVNGLGIVMVDISAGSGNPAFRADDGLRLDYNLGIISEGEFITRYLERLKLSRRHYKEDWERLIVLPEIAIRCKIKQNDFHYSDIFLRALKEFLTEHTVTMVLMGELPPPEPRKKRKPFQLFTNDQQAA